MSGGGSLGGGYSKSDQSSQIDASQLQQMQGIWNQSNQLAAMLGQGSQYSQQMMQNQDQLYGQGQQMLAGLQNNPFMSGPYQPSQAATGQIGALSNLLNTQGQRMSAQAGQGAVQSGVFGWWLGCWKD